MYNIFNVINGILTIYYDFSYILCLKHCMIDYMLKYETFITLVLEYSHKHSYIKTMRRVG